MAMKVQEDKKELQTKVNNLKAYELNENQMAKTQTEFNNLFIDMERQYDMEENDFDMSNAAQKVFNKLHDEIILFNAGVKSIMDEIDPIKHVIIQKLSSLICNAIPNSEVQVYGSHATKLCLHWSDIDLVLKPKERAKTPRGTEGIQGAYREVPQKNWLQLVYAELKKQDNCKWVKCVDFIEHTTVPVIKMQCLYQSEDDPNSKYLPNGNIPRYPHIVEKPINIDISLMSENHNGLACVDLVKAYLAESNIIEPLILIMKQMLKVWGFNDPYHGGLSSYALFLMIVSFLQEKKKPLQMNQVNLGEVLLELIKHYAELDTAQYAIACRMPGSNSETRNVYPNNDNNVSETRL